MIWHCDTGACLLCGPVGLSLISLSGVLMSKTLGLLLYVEQESCRINWIHFIAGYHKRPLNQALKASFGLVCPYVSSFGCMLV